MSQEKSSKYWKDNIFTAGNDARKVWRSVDALLGEEKVAADQSITAQIFHDFIDKKVADIRASTASAPDPTYTSYKDSSMESFEMVTNDDILAIIMSSPNKQCDLVPTWLLKNCAVLLAPVVSKIINASLRTGHFPSSWKHATITPIHKKAGLDPSIPSSYRPVSNLTFLSKVLEHVVHIQMTRYLAANNLLPKFQSAYRKSHSTETALMKVLADLTNAIDDERLALVAFLDLSAAFDTVDHQVLLHRMLTSYGVSSTVRRWFSSYLTDRTQSVWQ